MCNEVTLCDGCQDVLNPLFWLHLFSQQYLYVDLFSISGDIGGESSKISPYHFDQSRGHECTSPRPSLNESVVLQHLDCLSNSS